MPLPTRGGLRSCGPRTGPLDLTPGLRNQPIGLTLDGCRPPGLVACLQCANWDSVGTERVAFRDKRLILHIDCSASCPFKRLLQAVISPEQFARPGGEARRPVDAE